MDRSTKKEFLRRAVEEIHVRMGIRIPKEDVWSLFTLLLCVMFQVTVESRKLTICKWLTLYTTTTRSKDRKNTAIRIRASLPVQEEASKPRPNFFLSLLDSSRFNVITSDLEPDEPYAIREYDCDGNNAM